MLPIEIKVSVYMLGERHRRLFNPIKDFSAYTLRKIGEHNVVITGLPAGRYCTTSSAAVAARMIPTFPNIKLVLIVGISSGILQKIQLVGRGYKRSF